MADTIKKSVKVDYFRVVCRDITKMDNPNIPDCLFDLHKWIALFDNEFKEIKKRAQPYYREKIRLDDFSYIETDLWNLVFLRMRDTGLPKKAYNSKETEDMELDDDEYIGEEAIAIYDDSINVLALQRNRDSLSVTGVERYINELWEHRDNNRIYLRPIMSNEDINSLLRKQNKNYRKIRFKIADIANNMQSFDYSPLGGLLKGLQSYDGAFVDVTVSMGHRKKHLNDVAVNNTLQELVSSQPNVVNKAEVFYKEGDAPVEYMDLLSGKLSDYMVVEQEVKKSISTDYLSSKILEQYKKSKDKIKGVLNLKE